MNVWEMMHRFQFMGTRVELQVLAEGCFVIS